MVAIGMIVIIYNIHEEMLSVNWKICRLLNSGVLTIIKIACLSLQILTSWYYICEWDTTLICFLWRTLSILNHVNLLFLHCVMLIFLLLNIIFLFFPPSILSCCYSLWPRGIKVKKIKLSSYSKMNVMLWFSKLGQFKVEFLRWSRIGACEGFKMPD